VVVSLGNALHIGSKSCLYEFTELNFLSVGSQLPPRTLNILIDRLILIVPFHLGHVSNKRKKQHVLGPTRDPSTQSVAAECAFVLVQATAFNLLPAGNHDLGCLLWRTT